MTHSPPGWKGGGGEEGTQKGYSLIQSHVVGPRAGTWARNKNPVTSRVPQVWGPNNLPSPSSLLCFWGNWGSGLKQVAQDHMGSESQAFRAALISPTNQLCYGLALWLPADLDNRRHHGRLEGVPRATCLGWPLQLCWVPPATLAALLGLAVGAASRHC